jgi:hypothetical protein
VDLSGATIKDQNEADRMEAELDVGGVATWSESKGAKITVFSSASGHAFLCPITGEIESISERKLRIVAWRLLKNSLVHHKHLYASVEVGKVSQLWKVSKDFALGSTAKIMLVHLQSVSLLSKSTSDSWSHFAAKVIALHAKVYQVGVHPGFRIGSRLFLHAVLRACDNEPSLITNLALLRKQDSDEAPLKFATVMEVLGNAWVASPGSKALVGFAGPGAKKQFCWDYNDGKCSRSSAECRFLHAKDPDYNPKDRAPGRTGKGGKGSTAGKRVCMVSGCNADTSAHPVHKS